MAGGQPEPAMAISPSLQQQSNEPSYLLSLHKIIIQRMVAWIAQPSLSTLGSCHVYLNAVQSSIQFLQAHSIDQVTHPDHMQVHIQ